MRAVPGAAADVVDPVLLPFAIWAMAPSVPIAGSAVGRALKSPHARYRDGHFDQISVIRTGPAAPLIDCGRDVS